MKNLIFMFLFMLVGAFSVSAAIPENEMSEISTDIVQDSDVLKTIDSAVLDVRLISESISHEVQKESIVFESKSSEAEALSDSMFAFEKFPAEDITDLYFNSNSISERKAKTKDYLVSTQEQPYLII